jgi:hypothetical protein
LVEFSAFSTGKILSGQPFVNFWHRKGDVISAKGVLNREFLSRTGEIALINN